jgi:hypothetical protein
VLGKATLWHLEEFLQSIKSIILEFTPSTTLLYLSSSILHVSNFNYILYYTYIIFILWVLHKMPPLCFLEGSIFFYYFLLFLFLLLGWVGIYCGNYKSPYNISNISYLNLPLEESVFNLLKSFYFCISCFTLTSYTLTVFLCHIYVLYERD